MQINTTPTLLQAIRQDPDTGLRWAMRDYAALDLRVSTVNTRLSRGRDRLRRQLQERGYTHG